MNALACPRCAQLDAVQNVQSVYAAQSGVTHSTGIAAGGVLGAGPVVMGTVSHGTQASHLALRLSPPPAPRRRTAVNCGVLLLFAALIGLGLWGVVAAATSDPATEPSRRVAGVIIAIVFFGLVAVLFGLVLGKGRRLKGEYDDYAAVWPAMSHVWQNAMVCLRCHGIFFPPGVLHAGLGPSGLIPIDAFHDAVTEIGTRLALDSPMSSARRLPPAPPPA